MFKSETTSFHYFPQGDNIGHPTLGRGGKKTFKRYLKSEYTDKQTDGRTDTQMDISTNKKQRADALKIPHTGDTESLNRCG